MSAKVGGAPNELEKGVVYYPMPPSGPPRKTFGKRRLIELEKLHHCTFVSGDFQNGGDITFVMNMLVTQRMVMNFRSMILDVNVVGDGLPVANKKGELVVSKAKKQNCEECEKELGSPIQYCSCCGIARCSDCMISVGRIPAYVFNCSPPFQLLSSSFALRHSDPFLRYGYEDVSWKKLREYARPAEANIVTKMLQKSSGLAGTAADRVSSMGSSLTSSMMFQGQAVFERVKSLIPSGAPAAAPEETEEQKSKRLAEEAGAEMIRKQKAAAEERAKAVKEQEDRAAEEAKKNPAAAAVASSTALKPQPKPKELPNEVQKRPNDPSKRQPCRTYSWLSAWKEFYDKEVSIDGGDVTIVHVRKPFSTADASKIVRDCSPPIMSSLLDKEIGWITHEEREQFEDALFSQPIGKCCEGRLKAEREALQTLIRKTQLELTSKIVWLGKNDGSNTQRTTASDASAMAAAAADEAAEVDEEEEEDSGDPEQIAMLPSYKITEWGTIIWTFMEMHSGDVKKLQEKPIRKYDSKTGMNSAQWLPERWVRCCPRHHLNICFLVIHVNRHMSVGVLARGMLKEPLVHDQFCCSTELEGEKQIIDPVSKQPKTEKFKFMCKEPITPKNASTCASCSRTFCNKKTCMFSEVELEEFEKPEGSGETNADAISKEKKAVVLKGSVCAVCKALREESKGAWRVKAPKPQEPPPTPNPLQFLLDIISPPPLTEEQMEKEKEKQEKAVGARVDYLIVVQSWICVMFCAFLRCASAPPPPFSQDEKFQDKKYKFLGKISFGLIKRPEED
jgi:hypothetical protein